MINDIEKAEIHEAFHEEAHERGFNLDQEWSDSENPYLDGDTNLAFDFFKSGWQTAKAHEAEKLKGYVVVPVQCPDPDFADALFQSLTIHSDEIGGEEYVDISCIDPEKIWALMVEAARGGNE